MRPGSAPDPGNAPDPRQIGYLILDRMYVSRGGAGVGFYRPVLGALPST